ncbi:hypothetical protein QX776_03430 [Alteromonadaceae bacterium BrNp21-10]|nr:hypothetical protein [Alteromonadaceae bacterium BrNp21-10]
MSKLDKDQVIEAFTQAYQAANGKAPTIEAKGGWYSVDGGKNIRLAQLTELTAELAGAKDAPAKKEAAAAKPKAEKKAAPAAKKAAPVAKKAAAPKAKKQKSSFSVKAFWNGLLGNKDEDCKAPR